MRTVRWPWVATMLLGTLYPLLHRLASNGWVCVSASYPLVPAATFPDQLVALKQAVNWMRTAGAAYGIDPAFIAVTGGSAGGHLASLVALTGNRVEYQPGFENADTSVQAAVPVYGIYDFLNRNRTRDDWPIIPRGVMKARRRLVQVAALAVAAVESIDRKFGSLKRDGDDDDVPQNK